MARSFITMIQVKPTILRIKDLPRDNVRHGNQCDKMECESSTANKKKLKLMTKIWLQILKINRYLEESKVKGIEEFR